MRRRWLSFLLCICLGLMAAAIGSTARATAVAGEMRIAPVTNGVLVRLALSEPLADTPRALALDSPLRWAVDLPGASSIQRELPGMNGARTARVSQFDPDTVRIVLDMDRPMRLVAIVQDARNTLELRFHGVSAAEFSAEIKRGRFLFPRFSQENFIAVPPGPRAAPDLAAESARRLNEVEAALAASERQIAGPAAATEARQPPTETSAAEIEARQQRTVMVARQWRGKKRPLVVIDPGHGGKDPGAPSATHGNEKTVTLAIARAAKRAIEKRGGVDVRLTRDDDRFITLGGRVRLARQWGADLFISIHADSAANKDARGATVYTLSDVASDRQAAQLAAKENRADMIAGVDLTREDRDVTTLLLDLAQRDSMNASSNFAQLLQRQMQPRGVHFRSNFHRFAGFAVLKNLGVPAVLLETGYLSNTTDSAYLFSSTGQRAIAEGVADAAVRYLKEGI